LYDYRRQLVRDDDPDTVIAISHRSNSGIFWGPKRKASLDVSPAGMNILDDIILTFTWTNYIRRGMESAR
jgi:hypothetical protein